MTPLQKQTDKLVKTSAGIAGVLFTLVGVVTYFNIPDHPIGDREAVKDAVAVLWYEIAKLIKRLHMR